MSAACDSLTAWNTDAHKLPHAQATRTKQHPPDDALESSRIRDSEYPLVRRMNSVSWDATYMPAPEPSLFEYHLSSFHQVTTSRSCQQLLHYFCNTLSHLIVLSEEHGNPFQQLVIPLCCESKPLLASIFTLSAAHRAPRYGDTSQTSLYFYDEAIRGLASLLSSEDTATKQDEVLATVIILVYYEAVRNSPLLTSFAFH